MKTMCEAQHIPQIKGKRPLFSVYADMASVRAQLEAGLPRLAGNRKALRSLTAWPWINRLILNAH